LFTTFTFSFRPFFLFVRGEDLSLMFLEGRTWQRPVVVRALLQPRCFHLQLRLWQQLLWHQLPVATPAPPVAVPVAAPVASPATSAAPSPWYADVFAALFTKEDVSLGVLTWILSKRISSGEVDSIWKPVLDRVLSTITLVGNFISSYLLIIYLFIGAAIGLGFLTTRSRKGYGLAMVVFILFFFILPRVRADDSVKPIPHQLPVDLHPRISKPDPAVVLLLLITFIAICAIAICWCTACLVVVGLPPTVAVLIVSMIVVLFVSALSGPSPQ